MPKTGWKHLRGRSSYSPVSFNTFITEGKYTAQMLKEDLEEAGIIVISVGYEDQNIDAEEFESFYRQVPSPGSFEFSCMFEYERFTVGIDEMWQGSTGSRIIFEAKLLQLRYILLALGVSGEECNY